MAKVIFEFDSETDSEEIELVMNRGKMYSVLWDLDQEVFRKIIKYEDYSVLHLDGIKIEDLNQDQKDLVYKVIEAVRSKFHEMKSDEGIGNL